MLSFSDATGNLFNRIGRLGKLVSISDAYQAETVTYFTDTTVGATAQYNAEADIQATIGGDYQSFANVPSGMGGFVSGVAQATLSRMVYRDNPMFGMTLDTINNPVALAELLRQMTEAGASVLATPCTATPPAIVGFGTGAVVASVIRPFDGRTLENCFSEVIRVACVADSYNGGATAGSEPFTAYGVGTSGNFDFTWPNGSGCAAPVSATDGSVSGAAGNELTNSGFDAFTGDAPDDWTINVGSAGTDFFEEVTEVYGTGKALRVLGTGVLVSIQQAFGSSAGTPNTLTEQTSYAVNLWMKRDGGVQFGTGTLVVDLIDDGGTVTEDIAGVPNTATFDLTTLNTFYAAFNAVFRTPLVVGTVFLRYRLTVGTPAGRSFYIDRTALAEMTQTYTAGPFVAVFSGDVPFLANDYCPVTVVNPRGAGGSADTFQTLFARLFPDMIDSGVMLNSSATPTISDTLITAG